MATNSGMLKCKACKQVMPLDYFISVSRDINTMLKDETCLQCWREPGKKMEQQWPYSPPSPPALA